MRADLEQKQAQREQVMEEQRMRKLRQEGVVENPEMGEDGDVDQEGEDGEEGDGDMDDVDMDMDMEGAAETPG
jgi:hypothetical protein